MRTVAELSGKVQVAAPVAVSSVPVGAEENVFVTQTERPAFEIGSGVPKAHPVAVQSTPAGVEPEATDPMLQFVPTQPDSVKRLIAPGGVALSGTWAMPPPSDRLPQRRFFNGTVPARSRNVLPQVPEPDVDVKSKPVAPPIVVLLVDDVVATVDVLLDVDVLELVEEVVDEVVASDVDELVELDVEEVDELVDDVVGTELDVDELVDDDVDDEVVDDVLVELDVLELLELVLVDVLVVDGLLTVSTRSFTQLSTRPWSVGESFVNWQSFGFFASSFAKQPFVGSAPPVYFATALSRQAPAFGLGSFPGVCASW